MSDDPKSSESDDIGSGKDAPPPVRAMKRHGTVWRVDKRDVLRIAAAGALNTLATGCSRPKDEDTPSDSNADGNDAVPPFVSGGITYRVLRLPDYNANLPRTGQSLAVIAFVHTDFFFREYDKEGRMSLNLHESKVQDKAALSSLKQTVQSVADKGKIETVQQGEIADLFQATVRPSSDASARKRMQGTEAKAETASRRMQGSASSGNVSGRRMQGAEGRIEGPSEQRRLGDLNINGFVYKDSRVVETYTDGYTEIAHSAGGLVVRTDALPEIVQMQLPYAVANPRSMPSAMPSATHSTMPSAMPSSAPRPIPPASPSPPSSNSGRTYRSGGHYWRPN